MTIYGTHNLNATKKIDLRNPLLRGILKEIEDEFDCSYDTLRRRYSREDPEVLSRVLDVVEERLRKSKELKHRKSQISEALAA